MKYLKLLIRFFCCGMIFNALMDIYAWFAYGWHIPSWAAALTWIGFSVILLLVEKAFR